MKFLSMELHAVSTATKGIFWREYPPYPHSFSIRRMLLQALILPFGYSSEILSSSSSKQSYVSIPAYNPDLGIIT